MATSTKARANNPNLPRSKSLTTQRDRRNKSDANTDSPPVSADNKEKPERPIPNYLKPTMSSRPDSIKFVRKNNGLEDNNKLLRRRSFDRPLSSFASSSSSASPRVQKSLNISPGRPRERPLVPREKTATTLRSSSFQGGRTSNNALKANPKTAKGKSPVTPPKGTWAKKSLTTSDSKKEAAATSTPPEKVSEDKNVVETVSTEGNQGASPVAQEEEHEVVKVVQVSDEVPKPEDKEMQVEAVESKTEEGKKKETDQTDISTVSDTQVAAAEEKEEGSKSGEEKVEEEIKEKIEEKSESKTQELLDNLGQDGEEIHKEPEKEEDKAEGDNDVEGEAEDHRGEEESADIDADDVKDASSVIDNTDEKEIINAEKEKDGRLEVEQGSYENVNKPKGETAGSSEAGTPGSAKRRMGLQGKKPESPGAYNDVIEETAGKLLEKRKNKVKALVGAFETVIDYESGSR